MPVYRQLGGTNRTISFAITRGAMLGTRSFTASGLLYRRKMGVFSGRQGNSYEYALLPYIDKLGIIRIR